MEERGEINGICQRWKGIDGKKEGIQCWKENREQMRMRGKTKTLGERERGKERRWSGEKKRREGKKSGFLGGG